MTEITFHSGNLISMSACVSIGCLHLFHVKQVKKKLNWLNHGETDSSFVDCIRKCSDIISSDSLHSLLCLRCAGRWYSRE